MTSIYKNWKLNLLALICFCLFIALGCWQLSRATQKESMQQAFALRRQLPPMQDANLRSHDKDLRFYRANLEGRYDNQHSLLLDNKVFHGQVGYEVYTPFQIHGSKTMVLVDRGFIPIGHGRNILPPIADINGALKIQGMLNLPPKLYTFGGILDASVHNWPKRIEYVNLAKIEQLIANPSYSLYPYILMLSPNERSAFSVEWQIVTMGPEKHRGYALQWFAFALTLLILFVALNKGKA